MNSFAVKKWIAGMMASMLVLSFASFTAKADEVNDDRTVTVNGTGSASAVPDTAAVVFAVTNTKETAKEAQDENAAQMKNILAALKDLALDEKDVKTSAFSLNPEYIYDDNGNSSISGYTAYTELTVSNQTIDMAGSILSACVNAGINTVNSVKYSCSNYDEAYKEALTEAVANAKSKAETLAAASDATVGRTVTVNEGYEDTSLRAAKSMASAMERADIALMAGESRITASVTVTYELK